MSNYGDNSWYFRNSLVRANYKNFEKNVFEDTSFLEKFFYNLLTGSKHELKNRYAHIDYAQEENPNQVKTTNQTLEEQRPSIKKFRDQQIIKVIV